MPKPAHDWHLAEWLTTLRKRQADLVRDLDWNKAKASLMVNCKQQYTRDEVNELAAYLNIQPFELLMHPEDAMAYRQLRHAAEVMVQIPFAGTASGGPEDADQVSTAQAG
ncbi:MAG: helix-turn-helix domain-containing protein [Pseudomonadota bacterium]